jgi:hypothetical protein
MCTRALVISAPVPVRRACLQAHSQTATVVAACGSFNQNSEHNPKA